VLLAQGVSLGRLWQYSVLNLYYKLGNVTAVREMLLQYVKCY